jgi:hypothetical protein
MERASLLKANSCRLQLHRGSNSYDVVSLTTGAAFKLNDLKHIKRKNLIKKIPIFSKLPHLIMYQIGQDGIS